MNFETLETATENYWNLELAASPTGVVPTVMIGWDTRPRQEHPPSWQPNIKNSGGFVKAPTPDQFAEECNAAIRFITDHRQACPASLALIYAWNESSEGGPLQPSLGDRTASKLRAAAKVLK